MMTPGKDYYAILGIPRDASQSEIERHYHALAKKWHPDLNRDPDATQRMQALNEAYAVLSDPLLRARYDAIHGTPNWTVAPGPFGISSVTLRNVSSLFGTAFTCLAVLIIMIGFLQPFGALFQPTPETPYPELGGVAVQPSPTTLPVTPGTSERVDNATSPASVTPPPSRPNVPKVITPMPTFVPTLIPPDSSPVPTSVPVTPARLPLKCAQSLPTRLHPGQVGQTVAGLLVKIRQDPSSATEAINLAPHTQFRTTGNPVCALVYGNPAAQVLWWPVELLSGRGSGLHGWIAESGSWSEHGPLVYNIELR